MYPDLTPAEIIDLSEIEEATDSSETISLSSDNEQVETKELPLQLLVNGQVFTARHFSVSSNGSSTKGIDKNGIQVALHSTEDEIAQEILEAENKLLANGKVQGMDQCLQPLANNQTCSGSSSQSNKSTFNQAHSTSNHQPCQPYQLKPCGQVYNPSNNQPYQLECYGQIYNVSYNNPYLPHGQPYGEVVKGQPRQLIPILEPKAHPLDLVLNGQNTCKEKIEKNDTQRTSRSLKDISLRLIGMQTGKLNLQPLSNAQVYNGSSSQPPPYTKEALNGRPPPISTIDQAIIHPPPSNVAQPTVPFARVARMTQYPMITPEMPAPSVRPIPALSMDPILPIPPMAAPMTPPKAQSLKSQPLQLSSNSQAAIHSSVDYISEPIANREGQHEKVGFQLLVNTEGQTQKLRLEPLANKEQTEILYFGPLPFKEVYCIPNDKHLEQLADGKVYRVPNGYHLEQLPGVWKKDLSSQQMSD